MKNKRMTVTALVTILGVASLPAHAGGTYAFTVSCSTGKHVIEWQTGDIDPGREYLRVATGTNHPGCSISNYNAPTDSSLPRKRVSGSSGLFKGLGPLGKLLGGLF